MMQQRGGRSRRKRPARADGGYAFIRLDDVTVPADNIRVLRVGDQQQGLQMTQDLVSAPVFGQLHDAARQVAVELLEFGFEPGEKRKRVRCGPGKSGQNLVVVKSP